MVEQILLVCTNSTEFTHWMPYFYIWSLLILGKKTGKSAKIRLWLPNFPASAIFLSHFSTLSPRNAPNLDETSSKIRIFCPVVSLPEIAIFGSKKSRSLRQIWTNFFFHQIRTQTLSKFGSICGFFNEKHSDASDCV